MLRPFEYEANVSESISRLVLRQVLMLLVSVVASYHVHVNVLAGD